MKQPLMRTSPETQGISSRSILELMKQLDSIGNEVHGLMIARNDCVVAETYMQPYAADIPHSCHSLGKSYTCTAAGIACTQGLMTPDTLLVDIFREEIENMGLTVHEKMKRVRIRDLMTMSSGTKGMPTFDDAWLINFLVSDMSDDPGTRFHYNTTGSCVLGAAVEKVTGKGLLPYLRENLLETIGVGDTELVWQKFTNGMYAEPGICATTEANLRLGLFYLHEGLADGRQIIDRGWIHDATTKQIETSTTPGVDDGSCGYGYQLWLGRVPGLYRFDGGQGQLCFVYPQKQCVIAMHQAGHDPYGVAKSIEIVHEFMKNLPFEADENYEETRALQAYLASRKIAESPVNAVPDDTTWLEGVYHVAEGKIQPWIEVYPFADDFWHYFYDPSVPSEVKTVEIRVKRDAVTLIFNQSSHVEARLDGTLSVQETKNVLPGLEKTCATAWFEDNSSLWVDLRWLCGWFRVKMHLTRGEHPGQVAVFCEKEMLHDTMKPVTYQASLRKIAL